MYVETFLAGKLGRQSMVFIKKIERKKPLNFIMESQKTQNVQSNPEKKRTILEGFLFHILGYIIKL